VIDVIVLGGGIAGLATAYELHRRGRSFVLLERAARPGGVILSEEYDGYVIDAGPDSLLVQKPEGIRLCEELGLGDRLVPMKPPRLAYIQRHGQLHPLPATGALGMPTRLAPLVGTKLFSWPAKVRMAAEPLIPGRRDAADESIASFITRRFGREATTYLAEPLLAGIHAGDVERLSVNALFPALARAEREHGSVLRALRRRAPAAPSPDGAFKSLAGGLSELVRAVVKALPTESVLVGRGATRIDGRGPYTVVTQTNQTLQGRALVLATPAFVTGTLVRTLSPALAQLCGEIPYASTAVVVLAFARGAVAHPLKGSGFVVPRVENSGILAASWLSSKWPYRAPDDAVLLRAFIGGARDPTALERTDAELAALARTALAPILGISAEPRFTRVYRWDHANAQHEVGHLARLAEIDRVLAQHPGLFVTGSGFRGVGIPDGVADGRATALAVDQWLLDTSHL
jgi:oxygen-dependent protoporphyrinogen oxidase